jgi:hypothetical protein
MNQVQLFQDRLLTDVAQNVYNRSANAFCTTGHERSTVLSSRSKLMG